MARMDQLIGLVDKQAELRHGKKRSRLCTC